MINEFNIYFDTPKTFEIQNIKPLAGLVGLYFIFTTDCEIQYPFKKSKLLYIGMSEKKTNSIGSSAPFNPASPKVNHAPKKT